MVIKVLLYNTAVVLQVRLYYTQMSTDNIWSLSNNSCFTTHGYTLNHNTFIANTGTLSQLTVVQLVTIHRNQYKQHNHILSNGTHMREESHSCILSHNTQSSRK